MSDNHRADRKKRIHEVQKKQALHEMESFLDTIGEGFPFICLWIEDNGHLKVAGHPTETFLYRAMAAIGHQITVFNEEVIDLADQQEALADAEKEN